MKTGNPFEDLKKDLTTEFKKLLDEKNSPDELLTREKTAEVLDIALSTLWDWTKKGKIQAYGIGDRVYYKRSDIEKALQPINFKKVA